MYYIVFENNTYGMRFLGSFGGSRMYFEMCNKIYN